MPLRASAGGPTTAHKVTITLKTISQTTNSKGDGQPDKVSAKTSDVFAACVGHSPSKTEGIYLFLNCGDPNLSTGTIEAMDTQPLTDLGQVGTLTSDTEFVVVSTKGGGATRTAVSVPVQISISCNAGGTTADLFGIMNVKYSTLGTTSCPNSVSLKVVGTGFNDPPGDFTVGDGSSVSAKRVAGVSLP
jgi:hypothetical protein